MLLILLAYCLFLFCYALNIVAYLEREHSDKYICITYCTFKEVMAHFIIGTFSHWDSKIPPAMIWSK